MKQLPMHRKRTNYSFLSFEYIAKPMVPNANPDTEAPQDRKFKKKLDSNTCITIKKGRTIPTNIRNMPMPSRRRGEFIKLARIMTIVAC